MNTDSRFQVIADPLIKYGTFLFIEKKVSGSPSSKLFRDLQSKTDFITVALLVFPSSYIRYVLYLSRLKRYLLSLSIDNTELIYLVFFSGTLQKRTLQRATENWLENGIRTCSGTLICYRDCLTRWIWLLRI